MIAFVLSGGGNRGAMQIGALQVLLERGIQPDLLVGTSAGAINAACLAADPTPDGARRLAQVWEGVTPDDIYPGNRWNMLWRLIRNCESLFPNLNFQHFVQRYLRAMRLHRFGDIDSRVSLRIVAARLDTGTAHVWGDRADDSLFDALMASTAFPPFHPPWRCNGAVYVDGAFAANLPISVAIKRGAREIFALDVARAVQTGLSARGAVAITFHACQAFLTQQLESQMQLVTKSPQVKLNYIPLTGFVNLPVWDFNHTREMIRAGRAAMEMYLDRLPCPQMTTQRAWLDSIRARWDRVRHTLDERGRFLPGVERKIIPERG